jgi:membrane-associated phospholipid phosphatase
MPIEIVAVVRAAASSGAPFARRHGFTLLLIFLGVLLPLAGFGALAHELREGEGFFFDLPSLEWAHFVGDASLDRFFVVVASLGYLWGVVPADIALVAALVFRRRVRETLFATFAIVGSALLNLAAKPIFARDRPTLWQSIAPEGSYSFPSGHAMGSMTLACVVVLLCWPTRGRWPVALVAAAFVVLVGISRLYLGVHYPSDILAAWTAAIAWTCGVYAAVFGSAKPWEAGTGTPDPR